MTKEEETTTPTHTMDIPFTIEQIDHIKQRTIRHIREAQQHDSPLTEAALIRAHAALESALVHLREAEAPFHHVTYDGYTYTPTRVQDIADPSNPPSDT